MTAALCPFASRCWMAGNYVFCKTATCKEPLIERGTGAVVMVEGVRIINTGNKHKHFIPVNGNGGIEYDPIPSHDNGADGVEPVATQTTQGELF